MKQILIQDVFVTSKDPKDSFIPNQIKKIAKKLHQKATKSVVVSGTSSETYIRINKGDDLTDLIRRFKV